MTLMLPIVKCRVEGCERPQWVRKHGLCRPHYLRYWEGKPVGGPIPEQRKLTPYKPKKVKA